MIDKIWILPRGETWRAIFAYKGRQSIEAMTKTILRVDLGLH